jgi:hypothetical protein
MPGWTPEDIFNGEPSEAAVTEVSTECSEAAAKLRWHSELRSTYRP